MEIPQEPRINPWISIWIKPRRTSHYILEQDSETLMYLLAAIGGIVSVFDRMSDRELGDDLSLVVILAIAFIGGPVAGVIGMYISAAVLSWTGAWFKGQAHKDDIAQVYAWSNVPMVFLLVCWLGILLMVGPALLRQ